MDKKLLQGLREQIDSLDSRILDLLNERAKVVIEVGKAKEGHDTDFYVPSREKAIFERLCAENAGPFPNEGIQRVFREIISASLSLEAKLKVAYLGPSATFTHVASMKQFGQSAQLVPLKSIPAIFEEVERGRAAYGVVPVENSIEGVVSHTLDMFMGSDLQIIAEIRLEIAHFLLSASGKIGQIRKVLSHPQPLGQCRNWLAENLPDVPLVDVSSTAMAAQMAAEDDAAAAIASEAAGSLYGLKVVKSNIADSVNNYTRFLVIGRKTPDPGANDKTSIMFSVNDTPGVLYRMLEPFEHRKINLTKIESRPMKSKAWEYIFFLDMDGHIADENVSGAIDDLKQYCQFLKVLGSYPKA